MFKKIGTLALCFSLFLASSAFAASSVETNGDLTIHGIVESTSGGFKFPDGSTLTTSGLSGLLFNVGFVVDNSNSNPGDLSMGAIKFGTGATGEGMGSQRIGSGNVNGLDLYTNSTSRLAITNSGFVGIGTRTPQFQLTEANSLNGKWTRAQFGYRYPLYLMEWSPAVGFNAYWDFYYKYGTSNPAGVLSFDVTIPGGFEFRTAPSGTEGANAPMATRMAITNDGKVGIGTTSPSQALDVVGNINTSGTVTAGPGATHTPLAYGVFDGATDSRMAGSENITCSWSTINSWYACTITGEVYNYGSYVANVTHTGSYAIPVTGSSGGKLVIYFYDSSAAIIKANIFSVTVYKP